MYVDRSLILTWIIVYIPDSSLSYTTPSSGYDACYYHNIVDSDYTRSINYTLQYGDNGTCESNNITAGWYRFSGYQNIPTHAPQPGQCGSSYPIYLQGEFPTIYAETRTMTACIVGNASGCMESWGVTVKYCGGYNIAYLTPSSMCGRYCMEQTPAYYDPSTSPTALGIICYNHTIMYSNLTRSVGYIYQYGDTIDCESSTLVEGWYRFKGYQNIPTTPVWPGQCGTIHPIWLNGSYPTIPGETKIMTACIPGNTTACDRSWPVAVKHCSGYNIAYLKPAETCGRYCMESDYVSWPTLPPWISPCVNHTVIVSNLTRTTHYFKQYGDTETCESSHFAEGWYRYENFENIPTEAPTVGQCGSMSPIWLKGRYPAPLGNSTMTACAVNSASDCTESWNVTVMNCYSYNVFYLQPVPTCGRYCMNSSDHLIFPSATLNDWTGNISTVRSDYNADLPMSYTDLSYHPSSLASSSQVYFTNGYVHSTMEVQSHGASSENKLQTITPSAMNTFLPFSSQHILTSTSLNTPFQNNAQSLIPTSTLNSYYTENSQVVSTESVMPSDSPYSTEVCNNPHIIYSNLTRSVGYIYRYGDTIDCESSTLVEGWYRFEGYQNIPTTPVWPGQCGTIYPIWLNGSYPTIPGEAKIMTACIPGNTTACHKSWPVAVKNCSGYIIAYLKPAESCGRYCMESDYVSWPTLPPWISPCVNHTVIESNFTRTTHYFKQYQDTETCESSNLAEGWYRYENFENIPTEAPAVGQCGSMSPIWLKGMYPVPFGNGTMTACKVNSISDCADSWNVTVMNCYSFNVIYLRPVAACGRYCMNNSNIFISQSATISASTSHLYSISSTMLSISSPTFTPSLFQSTTASQVYSWSSSQPSNSIQTLPPSLYQSNSASQVYSWSSIQPSSSIQTFTPSLYQSTSVSQVNSMSSSQPSSSIQTFTSSVYQSTSTTQVYNMSSSQPSSLIQTFTPSLYQSTSTSQVYSMSSQPSSSIQTFTTSLYQSTSTSQVYSMSSSQLSSSMQMFTPYLYQSTSTSQVYIMSTSQPSSSIQSITPPLYQSTSTSKVYSMSSSQLSSSIQTFTPSLFQSTSMSAISSTFSTNQETLSSLSTTPSSSTTDNRLELSTYIYYIYPYPVIPSYLPTSSDRQLMFQCSYYTAYGYGYGYNTILNNYLFDVMWEVDDVEFIVKSNLTLSQIETLGRLKGTELSDGGIKMGFNIKCGIRFSVHQHLGNNSYVKSSWSYYVGLDIWPKTLSISSGQSASIYVWSTVPIACKYDSSYPCKLVIEMVDFNEQFTSGAPKYCNESITEMTKPSLCGLELDGWRTPWTWQTLNVNLPENTAQDQEYTAKLHLKVSSAVDDPMWLNYYLPEIHINVVNDNVTDDYWWWYGWCFTGTDPWFFTFDWQWYGFHDEGEFVLYRHKTKPIEVHTIQRRYEPEHTWTEHCAIAIRAASDVFIIYGCGRPTKWIVRREGCDTGNEYLEVYSRWGGYEVTLPTGSRVYVWISVNRRLNAYITLSRTDRYETEGLCGTWNRNYNDDYTGRDGHVYDDATLFARTWSVPSSDSLFIAKKRTEKLSQSFMYCTCLGKTLDKLSPNVDCSWKESLPVCPPINWGKEACAIRTKRSTDTEEDLTIDVSPDIVAYTQRPIVSSDWKNGWNQSSAEDACNTYFNQSVLFAACSSLSNVNGSSAISNCILNIQVAGTDEYMADSFEMFKTQCSNEVRTNNTLWTETNANGTLVAEMITQNDCPYDCKYKGIKKGDCVQGSCNCYAGFTGDDCRVDMNSPPTIATNISNDSFCDASTKACIYASVFGENFYKSQHLGCLVEKAEIVNNTLVRNGTSVTTSGNLVNLGEVKCPLIGGARRRRRSVTTSTSTDYYLVSVTNNGVNYSDPLPVIHFDSSCTKCTTTSTYVFCQLRSDVCVVNGMCYAQSSSQCSASTSSSDSNLWIIGVVGCVLLFVIILILLIKWCKTSRPVSPFCGGDDGPLYHKPLSRAGTPHSVTRINVHSVE